MSHITEISGYRKLSNGQFCIDVTCCGVHQHPHTVLADAVDTPEKRDASIEYARNDAAKKHEAAIQAEKNLLGEVGKTVEHE